jgi:HSP20 family protein
MTYRVAFTAPTFDSSLRGLRRDMDRAFSELFTSSPVSGATTPSADIVEEESGWTITLDLPGVRPESVEVLTEDRVLTIRAERVSTPLAEGAKRITQERSAGTFSRQFRLPRAADLDQIRASAELGVLTLRIGKVAPAQPRRVQVTTHDVATGSNPAPAETNQDSGQPAN